MKWWQPRIPSTASAKDDGAGDPTPASSGARGRFRNLGKWFLAPRPLIGLGALMLIGAVVATYQTWLPNLNKRPEYQVQANLIKITPPPDYVPSDFLSTVLKEAGLPDKLPLLDPKLVPNVVKAFQGNAWVQEVIQVRKGYPAELTVELRYRAPVAMIRVPGGRYPVDAQGIVLPPEDFTPEIAARYPEILNAPSENHILLGCPWNNPLVCEAAQLLAQLHDQVQKYDLAGIEIPPVNADGKAGPFILKTKANTEIVWGQGPAHDRPGQVPTRLKIDRLEDLGKQYGGSLDAGNDALIDLTLMKSIRTVKRLIADNPRNDLRRN